MDLVAEADEAKQRAAQVSTLEKQSRAAQERYQSQLKKQENIMQAGKLLGKMSQ